MMRENFLPFYIDNKIIEDDPFITIDTEGVGQIMEIGVKKEGRQTRISKSEYVVNNGGDPKSIEFCHKIILTM